MNVKVMDTRIEFTINKGWKIKAFGTCDKGNVVTYYFMFLAIRVMKY